MSVIQKYLPITGLLAVSFYLALVFAIGQFSLYRRFKRGILTLGLAFFIALHLVSLSYGLFPEDLGGATVLAMANKFAWFGLIERLNIGTLMLWMSVFALFTLRNPPPATVLPRTTKEA